MLGGPDLLRPAGRAAAGGHDAMRRVAVAFLVAGGLAAAAGTLVPDSDTGDHGGRLVLSAVCLGLALVLGFWRPPAPVLPCLPTVGILLVGVAVAIAEPLASTPAYYLMPILASAYFGSARRIAIDLCVCAVTLAAVLALWVAPEARSAIFIGTMIPAVCVALVVSGLKRRLDAHVGGLRRLADTDALTGALNHGAFGYALDLTLERYHATGRGAALLLIDVDHFKSVNDRFGHQEGDRMLRLVSGLLAEHKRRDDMLGRVGGEEFALLLPGADSAAARQVGERIRCALRVATAAAPASLTLSMGIAALSPALDTSHALLRAADRALYAAKDQGRDRAVVVEHAVAFLPGHHSPAAAAATGGASSSSSGTPLAWSARNESFDVFSSSRLTR
jgi:diguanylate cyclase (GGDEF)-like protein